MKILVESITLLNEAEWPGTESKRILKKDEEILVYDPTEVRITSGEEEDEEEKIILFYEVADVESGFLHNYSENGEPNFEKVLVFQVRMHSFFSFLVFFFFKHNKMNFVPF